MKNILRILAASVLLTFGVLPAAAQNTTGLVVATCGTVPHAFIAGNPGPFTVDTTGKLCTSGGGAAALIIGTTTITGGTPLRVLYDNSGVLGEYTNTQLTALINAATASLPGALPAWPNNTTTFFRGDGTYATLNVAAVSGAAPSASPTFTGIVTMPDSSTWTSAGINSATAVGVGAAAPASGFASTQAVSATSTDGLLLANPTTATVGAQKWSPRLHFTGSGWKTSGTAAGQTVDWIVELQPVQNTTVPSNSLVWSSQVNGAGYLRQWSVQLSVAGLGNAFIIGDPSGNTLNLIPGNDGSGTIGSASNRWGSIFGFGNLTLNGSTSTVSAVNLSLSGSAITLSNAAFTAGGCTALAVTITTGAVTCTASDERLKTDISDVDPREALAFAINVGAKFYSFENPNHLYSDGRRHIGFMAQDIKRYAPHIASAMVGTMMATDKTPGGTMDVDYADSGPLALAAIKALKADINSMREDLERARGHAQ